MNGGQPRPDSRFVEIADGNHILTSQYVRTDKEAVLGAMREFLADTAGSPGR